MKCAIECVSCLALKLHTKCAEKILQIIQIEERQIYCQKALVSCSERSVCKQCLVATWRNQEVT